jgi:hypothetical protein
LRAASVTVMFVFFINLIIRLSEFWYAVKQIDSERRECGTALG